MATITKPILLDETGQRIAEALESIDGKTRPVKTSELENDSDFQNTDGVQEIVKDYGFVTRLVSDLANYYLKGETYTQSEVNALIASISQFRYVVVTVLPTPAASTMNKIYLVPSSSAAAQNVKDEFITIDNGEGSDTRYTWEQIGSTTIDLSDYYTKSETDAAIAQETTRATAAEESLANGKLDKAIPITHDALVALRDNGELVPGQLYRITDYDCTTAQEDTQSANHQFDIIVTADSESTLNENARAVKHDGSAYFANSNLAAWELKYCLDNDTDRFAWADSLYGKGVIFYMKDEWNNECPYDFKNILFKRKLTNGEYDPNGKDTWVYTFNAYDEDQEEIWDATMLNGLSIDDGGCYCANNIIKKYGHSYGGIEYLKSYLNDNVFLNLYSVENQEYFECNSNNLDIDCYQNTFGNSASGNKLGVSCAHNFFAFVYNNTFNTGITDVFFSQMLLNCIIESSVNHVNLDSELNNSYVGMRNGTLIVRDIFEEQEYLTNAEIDAMFNTEDDS